MTTIAYRDGLMASDTRAYSGDKHPIGFKSKISRLGDGTLIGISSSTVGAPTEFLSWLLDQPIGERYESVSEDPLPVQALVVCPDGRAYYWDDGKAFTGPLRADFFAIGSGEQTALAALLLGRSAEEAVELAKQVDPWTGGKVEVMGHAN